MMDLVNSFLTSIYYLIIFAKIGFDTAENEPFNFHNFGSLQGFNFHRGVVSSAARSPTSAESESVLSRARSSSIAAPSLSASRLRACGVVPEALPVVAKWDFARSHRYPLLYLSPA
jgi:hypothetical protein